AVATGRDLGKLSMYTREWLRALVLGAGEQGRVDTQRPVAVCSLTSRHDPGVEPDSPSQQIAQGAGRAPVARVRPVRLLDVRTLHCHHDAVAVQPGAAVVVRAGVDAQDAVGVASHLGQQTPDSVYVAHEAVGTELEC